MKIVILILATVSLLFSAYTRDALTNTVYDSETGLTWEDQSYSAAEATAYSNGTEEGSVLHWSRAIDYCESLVLANKSDWRLPNFNELYMIVDYLENNPAIQVDATFGFLNTPSSKFWSSTTDTEGGSSHSAWYVDFQYGSADKSVKVADSRYVRCVRGGIDIFNIPAMMYLLD